MEKESSALPRLPGVVVIVGSTIDGGSFDNNKALDTDFSNLIFKKDRP
jgi:hypothetical protein